MYVQPASTEPTNNKVTKPFMFSPFLFAVSYALYLQ